MKRLLSMCILGLGLTTLWADEPKTMWEHGYELSSITYEEPGLMKEEGTMYGPVISYTYTRPLPKNQLAMAKLEGKLSWGSVDYSGHLMDGTPATLNDIDDQMVEIRFLCGSSLMPITPHALLYSGIGYRHLNDDMSAKNYWPINLPNPIKWGGYERQSNYYYVPIGLSIIPNNNLKLTGEYDLFIKGKQISYVSDVSGSSGELKNLQSKGYGLRGSIDFQNEWDKMVYKLSFWAKYWSIGESDHNFRIDFAQDSDGYIYPISIEGWEPKNNSKEFGITFSVNF